MLVFGSNVMDYTNTPPVKAIDFGSGAGFGDSGRMAMHQYDDMRHSNTVLYHSLLSQLAICKDPYFLLL